MGEVAEETAVPATTLVEANDKEEEMAAVVGVELWQMSLGAMLSATFQF